VLRICHLGYDNVNHAGQSQCFSTLSLNDRSHQFFCERENGGKVSGVRRPVRNSHAREPISAGGTSNRAMPRSNRETSMTCSAGA
jgi:hypothetical protein